LVAPDGPVEFQASSVAEFNVQAAAEAPADQASVAEFDLSSVSTESLPEAPVTSAPTSTPEADHTSEWEDMLTVEAPAAPAEESTTQYIGGAEAQEVVSEETPDEVLEEARFYLSQGMTAEAQSTIARLATIDPNHPALSELRSALGVQEPPAAPELDVLSSEVPLSADAEAVDQPVVDEATVTEFDLQSGVVAEPETQAAPEFAIAATPPTIEEERPVAAPEVVQEHAVEPQPIAVGASDSDEVLGDIGFAEEEQEAGLEELIPEVGAGESASSTTPAPIPPPARAAVSPPAMSAANPLADMVSDLEDVLGDIAPPPTPVKPARAPVSPRAPQPVVSAEPQISAATSAPPLAPAPAPVEIDQVQAHSMLSDLLDEFKEGMEEPAAAGDDDPDTHYNLGVAFREMGLLDEAIGELQKVCRALDNGVPFSQPIQAYTWLAQCLVDKGAAQAAVRWYEKALHVKGISDDSKLAVYYDMANAFEAAGNKNAALDNFMEVYGSNIDYRDVADRIRSLRK
jgi:tetratricopeptide (TPR) repeat protein